MARVIFTANLQRHLASPSMEASGTTVRALLDNVFERNPRLRSYILDDQGRVRRHVAIYVNDAKMTDRSGLSDPVQATDEVFVIQALTGG